MVLAMISVALLIGVIVQSAELANEKGKYISLATEYQEYKTAAIAEINGLTTQNQALNASYSILSATYAKLMSDYRSLNNSLNKLNADYAVLNESYSDLKSAYSGLNTSYFDLKTETEGLINKVDDYQKNLQDSMSWFNTNSNLSGIGDRFKTEQVQYNLRDNCFRIQDGKCKIKTGCLWVANTKLGLEYKSDITTTGKEDKLLSLQEFVKNYGGDCEDYALFYKAEINQILDECSSYVPSNIAIEGFVSGGTEDYFLDFKTEYETRYYLPRTQVFELKKEYIYPVEVCGSIFDLNTEAVTGHCVIAFTKNKINSTSQIQTELNKAPLIEPQTGEYMGLINDVSSGIYVAPKPEGTHSYIYMLVTDGDHMLFDETSGTWMSYSEFSQELGSLKQTILATLK